MVSISKREVSRASTVDTGAPKVTGTSAEMSSGDGCT